MALVSVIMPVFNRFGVSNEAIASVYAQTYRPIELIVVDDLSDEPFIPQVNSEENFSVKFIRHDQNKGPGASRETGRQAATGDYIAYLDSDDLWHPFKLEEQIAILHEHPDAGMCYCQSILFSVWPLKGDEQFRPKSNQPFDRFLPIVLETRPWGTSACIWTREASETIGPWHNGWHYEDVVYDVRAGCSNIKIAHLSVTYCYYRQESGNLSTTNSGFAFDQQAQSIEIITKELIDHQLHNNDDIRKKLETRLYKITCGAFHRRKRVLARLFLKYLRLITKTPKIWVYSFFLSISSFLLPIRLIDAINYRLNHIVFYDNLGKS